MSANKLSGVSAAPAGKEKLRVLVIGGGAAGLTAAVAAARFGASVTVAERMDRVGKKILASGNGRCNISNISIGLGNYHGAGAEPAFSIISKFGDKFIPVFFNGIGVPTALEDGARLYPRTFRSGTVLDALRAEASALDVAELPGYEAETVEKKGEIFVVGFLGKPCAEFDRVVVTAGGKASPFLGSNGSGYGLLTALGHRLEPPSPALTQVRVAPEGIRGLKGARVYAELTLLSAGMGGVCFRERGELLFTEYGVSGIPAMNLSCRLSPYMLKAGEDAQRRTADRRTVDQRSADWFASNRRPADQRPADRRPADQRSADRLAAALGRPGKGAYGFTVPAGKFFLLIDLLPEFTYDEAAAFINWRAERWPQMPLGEIVGGLIHKRVAEALIRRVFGGGGARSVGNLPLVGPSGASAPGISTAGVFTPGLSAPSLSTYGLSAPGVSTSDLSAPSLSAPGAAMSDLSTPGLSAPGVSTSDLSAPGVSTSDLSTPSLSAPGASMSDLIAEIKGWRHEVLGIMDFDNAQATYGGLSFDDFDADTLESKIVKGLYAAGEILDVIGDCGGYNLHWAWVSGYLAGMCAAGAEFGNSAGTSDKCR